MTVPAVGIAAIKLHKSNTAFNESARQQTAQTKLGRGFAIQAVEFLRRLGFFGDIHHFRRVPLHPKGEFVSGDPRAEFGILFTRMKAGAIQFVDKINGGALLLRADAIRRFEMKNRRLAAPQQCPLIGRRQITVAPRRGSPFHPPSRIRHHDKSRHVLVLGAEPVSGPGAQAWPAH